jgi:hypothetical protein
MTAETPAADRCPKCGAAVRPDDPWCTLCYADLRPPAPDPEPEPESSPEPESTLESETESGTDPEHAPAAASGAAAAVATKPDPVVVGTDRVTSQGEEPAEPAGPSWPCTACGESNPLARNTCSACGTPFLGGLRGQDGPLLDLPVVGDITKLGRGHRLALAAGVVLAVILLTLIVGLIFG